MRRLAAAFQVSDGGEVRATVRSVVDAACAAAVIVGQLVSGAMLVASALYAAWVASHGPYPLSVTDWLLLLPFVGTIVTGRRLRQTLRSRPPRPWAHAWFMGFALASLVESFAWFRDPMHDIALFFGSHGRWGCGVFNDDGSSAFLLRDDTMPFILFAPVLLAAAGHWLLTRHAQKRFV
jgi:hypothetical protein